ncbi:angiopoietin-1 receptor-like [Adelges cooleyi]|uniref:angiopoietin-1 receptor-like n=1 Tax=Adelges cooleyi TaxID=133065 RepID=UPI00217F2628|nr:angiopoietin-1 receptor-like [Adelges cooleyi]
MNFAHLIVFVVVHFTCTKFINAYTTELKEPYLKNYDISMSRIYNLQKNNNDSNSCSRPDYDNSTSNVCGRFKIKIYSKTNGIGMPIQFNGRALKSQKNDFEFIADTFYSGNISTTKNVRYDSSAWFIDKYFIDFESAYTPTNAPGGMLYYYPSTDVNISWTPRKTVKGCFSITYRDSFNVDSAGNEEYNKYYSPVLFIQENGKNIPIERVLLPITETMMILRTDYFFFKNKTYHFIIRHFYKYEWRRFGIKRIAHCNENGDVYEISSEELNSEIPNSVKVWTSKNLGQEVKPLQLNEVCELNKYGPNCSETCSISPNFCQGFLFCTETNECSCASGFTGRFCDIKCLQGTYGRDCKKSCSENCLSCDIHNGNCAGNCKKNFVPPDCTEKYPWLIKPPQIISSDYHSVKLNTSFGSENIGGSQKNKISLYQIVYKQSSAMSGFQYTVFKEIQDSNYAVDKIDNLLVETEYTFGAIVVTEDGNLNDEDTSMVNYTIDCQVPTNIDYGIELSKGAEYINVTWIKPNTNKAYDCEINEYMLKLMYNDEYKVVSTKNFNYTFDNLIPGYTYAVQVTARTMQGPAQPSNIFYETLDVQGYIGIQNIAVKLLDSETIGYVTWELIDAYKNASINYLLKYKINRHFSCSFPNTIKSNWSTVVIYNKTEYNILGLIPYTQYIIQVHPITEGYTYGDDENVIFKKTASSTPNLAPTLDTSQPISITNETTTIKWFVDNKNCNKLNGFPTGFHLILKNLKDSTQTVHETEDASIELTNLVPNTEYELQVFIKTNKGFNINYMLSVPFKTKG